MSFYFYSNRKSWVLVSSICHSTLYLCFYMRNHSRYTNEFLCLTESRSYKVIYFLLRRIEFSCFRSFIMWIIEVWIEYIEKSVYFSIPCFCFHICIVLPVLFCSLLNES